MPTPQDFEDFYRADDAVIAATESGTRDDIIRSTPRQQEALDRILGRTPTLIIPPDYPTIPILPPHWDHPEDDIYNL